MPKNALTQRGRAMRANTPPSRTIPAMSAHSSSIMVTPSRNPASGEVTIGRNTFHNRPLFLVQLPTVSDQSLPVSDSQMVLSKAAWALVLAPLWAIGVGLLIGVALWVISALTITVNGVPAAHAVFTQSHPMRIIGGVLASLPVYMVWALPTVGWLMFCSAWARSKPFLWAVLVPVLACVVISMMTILPGVDIAHDKVWYTVVYRGLLSVIPGGWYPVVGGVVGESAHIGTPDDLAGAIDLTRSWHVFATADLWIGAVVGVAFIAAAIRLRRWRDEG